MLTQYTDALGKMMKVEVTSRNIAPPLLLTSALCSLPVKKMVSSNNRVMFLFKKMAPPCTAELLLKLLVPLMLSTESHDS